VKVLGRRRRRAAAAHAPYGAVPSPPWQQHQLPAGHAQVSPPVPPAPAPGPYGYNGSNYGHGPQPAPQHGQAGQPYLGDRTRDVRYGQFSPPRDGRPS
jgi:hypothetical protein